MKNIIKILVIIFLFFLGQNSFAQSQGIIVEYNEFFDTDRPVEMKGFLYATPSGSIYEEDLSSRKRLKEPTILPENESIKTIVIPPLVSENEIYNIDFESNIVKTFGWIIADNKSKITDKVVINWELINEKKLIDGIECYKATAYFRGRNWEAWYAPSIPYSAGPMKFHGLPGLIIEISDETKRYNFAATKIEYFKDSAYQKQLDKFQSISYNQEQTLMEFVKERDEVRENGLANMGSRGAKIISQLSQKRNGMELIYEWEESK